MRRLLPIAVLCTLAAAASAAAAGPSPGVAVGGGGVTGAGVRYVALQVGQRTLVEKIRLRDGMVLRTRLVRGQLGIPVVAFDGSSGGLSRDGRTLVLASFAGAPDHSKTQFAVLDARSLAPRGRIDLPGSFSVDALAPDGATIYLIQYTSLEYVDQYRVRVYDVAAGKLVPGSIVDKREPKEPMAGAPVTRVASRDGAWAYTLYSRKSGKPFVHALDTVHRVAFCLDVAWHGSFDDLMKLDLRLSRDGRQLVLSRRDGTRVAALATPAG
jgi:hypothetical protein